MFKAHKWQFATRLRSCAFGWKSSRLAAQRLKEAASEIRKVGKTDPVLAAEGAIKLIEKLWPALQHVDTSSGMLGGVVADAVHEVIQYPIEAQVDLKTREKWLQRLWQAYQEDGVDYTAEVSERWGELCGSNVVRQKWLEDLLPLLKASWFGNEQSSYFRGETACLSCLLESGRHQELLELLRRNSSRLWHTERFGVKALMALGRPEEALEYADQLQSLYERGSVIDRECEGILLAIGKRQEAYSRYGLFANRKGTGVATFRAISDKYPEKDPKEILHDLIRLSPGTEGKWFATARQIGFIELAVKLAQTSRCEPRTLNRAAEDLLKDNPAASLQIAMSSLRWMCEGAAYELTGMDVYSACFSAMKAADSMGRGDETARQIACLTKRHPFINNFCRQSDVRIAKADSGKCG